MKPKECSFLSVVNIVGVPYLSGSPEITSKSNKISNVLLASYLNWMWFFFSLPEDVLWNGAALFYGTWAQENVNILTGNTHPMGTVWEINASASYSQMGWLWGMLHIVSPRVPRGLELMVHRSELLTDALLFWDFLLTFTHVLIFASWDHYLKSPSVPAFILRESKPKK